MPRAKTSVANVRCPYCKAKPGEPCRGRNYKEDPESNRVFIDVDYHTERYLRASELRKLVKKLTKKGEQ